MCTFLLQESAVGGAQCLRIVLPVREALTIAGVLNMTAEDAITPQKVCKQVCVHASHALAHCKTQALVRSSEKVRCIMGEGE